MVRLVVDEAEPFVVVLAFGEIGLLLGAEYLLLTGREGQEIFSLGRVLKK